MSLWLQLLNRFQMEIDFTLDKTISQVIILYANFIPKNIMVCMGFAKNQNNCRQQLVRNKVNCYIVFMSMIFCALIGERTIFRSRLRRSLLRAKAKALESRVRPSVQFIKSTTACFCSMIFNLMNYLIILSYFPQVEGHNSQ